MFKSNYVLRTLGALVVAFATVAATGCDTSPFDGTVYSSQNTDRTIDFRGYSTAPSASIRLRAKNQSTDEWETFAFAVASDEPSVAAGYWNGSPALYPWSVEAQLVSDASELDRWQPNTTAEVLIQEWDGSNWNNLYVYRDMSEIICMMDNGGEPYVASYFDCTEFASPVLHLVDVD